MNKTYKLIKLINLNNYRIKDYVGIAYKRDILKEIIDIARENVELVEFN